MINITATNLRNKIFSILKMVEAGEQVIITHNKKKVAYIKPVKKKDWRRQIHEKIDLLVSEEELIKPIDDVWDDYM